MSHDPFHSTPPARKATVRIPKALLLAAQQANAANQAPIPAVAPAPGPATPAGGPGNGPGSAGTPQGDVVRAALASLWQREQSRLYADAARFRSLLADELGGQDQRESARCQALELAVLAGIPARLAAATDAAGLTAVLAREQARLAPLDAQLVATVLADWAATVNASLWAAARQPTVPLKPPGGRLAALAGTVAQRQQAVEQAAAEAAARRQRELAAQQARFQQLYPLYRQVRANPHTTAAELAEAWQALGHELGLRLAAQPGQLVWTTAGVHVAGPTATLAEPWVNGLDMKFVPVPGTGVLFSIWATRVQDYQAFVGAVRCDRPAPGFAQEPTHPAVNVSWDDARAFCAWLTERGRAAGDLPAGASYRLPADWEWSVAVGLNEPQAGTPQEKDGKIKDVYPWGTQWPPPPGAGNYDPSLRVDPYPNTSPVGSFAPNQHGLFDLGGNVWEWCEDFYDGKSGARGLRGASWGTYRPGHLLSSSRNNFSPDGRVSNVGFRVVLGKR